MHKEIKNEGVIERVLPQRIVKDPSPSRTYVAICNKTNFNGHYFRKFVLPKHGATEGYQDDGVWVEGSYTPIYNNSNSMASWYFLNVLNFTACIDGVYSYEDFFGLKDQDTINARHAQLDLDFWRN